MPVPLSANDPEAVLEAERDIRARLEGRPLDFDSLLAVSNIYRAANAVRHRMESEVLSRVNLSWGGFTILFVLWVWGTKETADLAVDCGLAKGTLSGMLNTLEGRGLVARSQREDDKRRVVVTLTEAGEELIEDVFPRFNGFETRFTDELDDGERVELARLLRIVTATATGDSLVAPDTTAR